MSRRENTIPASPRRRGPGPYGLAGQVVENSGRFNAIERRMAANRRESAGHSWEIYGDPTPDPAHTETMVVHLLK